MGSEVDDAVDEALRDSGDASGSGELAGREEAVHVTGETPVLDSARCYAPHREFHNQALNVFVAKHREIQSSIECSGPGVKPAEKAQDRRLLALPGDTHNGGFAAVHLQNAGAPCLHLFELILQCHRRILQGVVVPELQFFLLNLVKQGGVIRAIVKGKL